MASRVDLCTFVRPFARLRQSLVYLELGPAETRLC